MAKRKSVKTNSPKVKKTKKGDVPVQPPPPGPRLRLEPRLSPSPSKKAKVDEDCVNKNKPWLSPSPSKKAKVDQDCVNKNKPCFEEHGLEIDSPLKEDSFCEENSVTMISYEEQNKLSDNESLIVLDDAIDNFETVNLEDSNPQKSEMSKAEYYAEFKKRHQGTKVRTVLGSTYWNDREWLDLAASIQAHGYSDLKKIADCVKTKNENDIREYLKTQRKFAIWDPTTKKWNRHGNTWNTLRPHYLATWPNVRKWRKMAYEQTVLHTRAKDYSKPVMSALCKKFYEEEEEPLDPQVINVKLIYKCLMSCMSGHIPPQLPPNESALVLDLLRELRSMPIVYDFEEERKFLQDFRAGTRFKPFHVKDEFRTQRSKEPEDTFSPNAVAVPEEIFLDLSRHKKTAQSFNPLVTPVWMLQKEQEVLEKYAAESNFYLD